MCFYPFIHKDIARQLHGFKHGFQGQETDGTEYRVRRKRIWERGKERRVRKKGTGESKRCKGKILEC